MQSQATVAGRGMPVWTVFLQFAQTALEPQLQLQPQGLGEGATDEAGGEGAER